MFRSEGERGGEGGVRGARRTKCLGVDAQSDSRADEDLLIQKSSRLGDEA